MITSCRLRRIFLSTFWNASQGSLTPIISETRCCSPPHTPFGTRVRSISAATSASSAKPASEIPSPKRYPLVGHIPLFFRKDFNIKEIHNFYGSLFDKYGPIFYLDLPFYLGKLVFTKDAKDIETVYRATETNPIRPVFDSVRQLRLKELDYYFEKNIGILVTQEEEWYRIRSQVQGPLMKLNNIHHYIGAMDEVAKDFLDRIEDSKDENMEVGDDFLNDLYIWGLESVSTVALNTRLEESELVTMVDAVQKSLTALQETEFAFPLWKIYPTKAYKSLVEASKIFLETSDRNIKRCLEDLKQKSPNEKLTLMEILLQNPKLNFKDVITLVNDMLLAGIDTTSNTVAFALYSLAKNPRCQKLLQQEIDDVIGTSSEPLTASHLTRMFYLKAVIKETLRQYPLAMGVARVLTSDVVLSGYLVPKGYNVLMASMFASHDETNIPRVKEFLPERWNRDRPHGPIPPYSVLPFSHGTRMCIGRRISEQELYTLLIRIFQKYNVEYHYKDMEVKMNLVFVPSEPCKFKFIPRQPR